MRILRIAQHFYPDSLGGAQYHAHAMSRDQAAMGHDVTVLTTRDNDDLAKIEETNGYTVIRFPARLSPIGNDFPPGMARYLWHLDADDIDLIHAHSHLYLTSNMAAIKSRFSGTPLVVTNHGLFSQSASRKAQEAYLKTLGGWTFNRAERVFCYTEDEVARLRDHGIRSETTVVSNGIDATQFTPDGEKSSLIDPEKPAVLCVSRLVDGKRPKDAIIAIERLREDWPDIQLYFCGDGYMREELEHYIGEQDLQNNVTLLGNVPYDEIPAIYRASDLLVLPSEEEAGSPRVVLEAMATEKPYVMANLQQTVDILNETGLTFPVGASAELAAAIETVLSDDELAGEIGSKGRQLVKEEFNWTKTVQETTEEMALIVEENND